MLKKRIYALVLSVIMAMTLLAGIALADEEYDSYLGYPGSLEFNLPAHGDKILGDVVQKKESGNAIFFVDQLDNTSGLSCYLNVRSSDGKVIVGKAVSVAGRGRHYVTYKNDHGTVGVRYRSSAQTDSDSSVSAYVGGTWKP